MAQRFTEFVALVIQQRHKSALHSALPSHVCPGQGEQCDSLLYVLQGPWKSAEAQQILHRRSLGGKRDLKVGVKRLPVLGVLAQQMGKA